MKYTLVKFIAISVSLIAIFSCNKIDSSYYYSYKGTCVTRFDAGQSSSFYYGNISIQKADAIRPNFTIFWGQRDGGFSGYLIFDSIKHSVEIVPMFGNFKNVNKNSRFYLTKKWNSSDPNYDPVAFNKWLKNIGYNAVFISYSNEQEVEVNRYDSSLVNVITNSF